MHGFGGRRRAFQARAKCHRPDLDRAQLRLLTHVAGFADGQTTARIEDDQPLEAPLFGRVADGPVQGGGIRERAPRHIGPHPPVVLGIGVVDVAQVAFAVIGLEPAEPSRHRFE